MAIDHFIHFALTVQQLSFWTPVFFLKSQTNRSKWKKQAKENQQGPQKHVYIHIIIHTVVQKKYVSYIYMSEMVQMSYITYNIYNIYIPHGQKWYIPQLPLLRKGWHGHFLTEFQLQPIDPAAEFDRHWGP